MSRQSANATADKTQPAGTGQHGASDEATRALARKYRVTSWFYDILDYPWERQYRQWRPSLLADLGGNVLEVGVGTGRNLRHYSPRANVTGLDLSPSMIRIAAKRAKRAVCQVRLLCRDATRLPERPSDHFDWYVATFLFCVLPDPLQALALEEMERVLKPGGRFMILEMVYSKDPRLLRRQRLFTPFVEKVYGARFDRHTLEHLQERDGIEISKARFLKSDTYLLIEGRKNANAGARAPVSDSGITTQLVTESSEKVSLDP
ncbi:MAG: class I SAM-dependent methyltransferase [Planctomycetota bacterium]